MPEPYRVLVVDDEAPARAKVRRMLGEDPRFTFADEARDGFEALDCIQRLRPDLVLLDIQMPGLTGFKVLEQLEPPRPVVIFATAYDHYALAAFEAAAVDYLLKPFDGPRFRRALDRAAQFVTAGLGDEGAVPLLKHLEAKPLERLLVKAGDRWLPLDLGTVTRLHADGRLVQVHTPQGTFLLRRPLSELAVRLDPRRFVRVHRSDMAALDAIAHLESWDHGDGLLVMKDGTRVVLSRTYRATFLGCWGLRG